MSAYLAIRKLILSYTIIERKLIDHDPDISWQDAAASGSLEMLELMPDVDHTLVLQHAVIHNQLAVIIYLRKYKSYTPDLILLAAEHGYLTAMCLLRRLCLQLFEITNSQH